MKEFFQHFFLPRPSNNHRSLGLQSRSLIVYLLVFLALQTGIEFAPHLTNNVLSYATNITIQDLLSSTNQKRAENGLSAVSLNENLNVAAKLKGENMFAEQYWAHTSPTGKTPWSFFNQAGYSYLYAGENLARDFADSNGVVEAWMNSPSHRENLLNNHYQEVGFAVVNGKYGDYETTLVIQEFGAKAVGAPIVQTPAKQAVITPPLPAPLPQVARVNPAPTQPITPSVVSATAPVSGLNINAFQITKLASISLGMFLILLLILDGAALYRQQVVRVNAHNMSHLMFLLAFGIIILLVKRGLLI